MKRTKLIAAGIVSLWLSLFCFTAQSAEQAPPADSAKTSAYAEEQQTAYLFSDLDNAAKPSDPLSTDNAVMLCARFFASLNGELSDSGITDIASAKSYALKNGLYDSTVIPSFDGNITRAQFAYMLSKAFGENPPESINSVSDIPDTAGVYKSAALMLYNAGIFTGKDSYGNFFPSDKITYSQAKTVFERICVPQSRVRFSTGNKNREAYYLIDDFLMSIPVRSKPHLASGWNGDYSGDISFSGKTAFTNKLTDVSTNSGVSIYRKFYPQYSGVLSLETIISLNYGKNGLELYFSDETDSRVFGISTYGGRIWANGKSDNATSYTSFETGSVLRIKLELDTDSQKAKVYVCGNYLGEFETGNINGGINKLTVGTTDKGIVTVIAEQVHLYRDYLVNDVFRMYEPGSGISASWDVTGNIAVEKILSNAVNTGDVYSAKMTAAANQTSKAYKSFEKTSGKVVSEVYILLPDVTDGAYISLLADSGTVIKINTADSKFYCGNTHLRDFSKNIWQLVRIEADFDKGTALIKIDGKTAAENIKISGTYANGIEIGFCPKTDAVMWFDDAEVFRAYEYDDYVPVPKRLETDYLLSMSVCNLWRNGSHYGWDYISSYDELTPVLGYYDEGSPEEMDWEIKYLVEHGFSTYHMCWYTPDGNAVEPIKKPRMVDAFHDGYFNAKYSDMLDFSIMWENANSPNTTLENFKNNIWNYWKEWYFSDSRYFTIDNKPYLTIYNSNYFMDMCGGQDGTKEVIAWMKNDIKSLGYDGLIVTFTGFGNNGTQNAKLKNIGCDGLMGYAIGFMGYDLGVNKQFITTGYNLAKQSGLDALALAGTGFNIIGWNQSRTPLMSPADFTTLLTWFRDEQMAKFSSKPYNEQWKRKFIQFDTWNEYGEGHYLFPTKKYGFGYLDAAAKVFAKNPTQYSASVNTVPTAAQKERITRLYPDYYTHLRREFLTEETAGVPNETVLGLNLTDSDAKNKFSFSDFKAGAGFSASDGFTGTASSNDPKIWYKKSSTYEKIVTARDIDVIHIQMSSSVASNAKLYFRTSTDSVWNEAKGFDFSVGKTPELTDYYIETPSNSLWTDDIYSIRLDPGAITNANVKVTKIEFMKYSDSQKPFTVTVDGTEASLKFDETREILPSELYVALREDSHLLTLLHISFEWNKNDGILKLRAPDRTEYVFTVGSSTVYINEKPSKLDRAVELYDAMPVIPIIGILKKSGYDYIYTPKDRSLEVRLLSKSITLETVYGGDAENPDSTSFYSGNNNITVKSVPDPENSSNRIWKVTGQNSQVWSYIRTHYQFTAGTTYTVDFDAKLDGLHNGDTSVSCGLYFNPRYADNAATDLERRYDHAKNVKTLSVSDGWVHIKYTFTVNDTYYSDESKVKDELSIFMNPVQLSDGTYSSADFSIDNFVLHKHTKPFELRNGDAESDDSTAFFGGSNMLNVERIQDPDNAQNHVWSITNTNTSDASWSYIRQETAFTAACTYKVSFDIKLLSLSDGSDIKDASVNLNPRYYDIRQLDIQNRYDHPVSASKSVSASDGWVHLEYTFTVAPYYDPEIHPSGLPKDQITVFVNPLKNPAGVTLGVNFLLDNFKVSMV